MNNKKNIKIAVLPGDGIGQDVIHAALPIFNALQIPVEISFGDIGWEYWKAEGNPVPKRTWELIENSDTALLGAITSKPEREAFKELASHLKETNLQYLSPVIQLRQKLNLYVNVRPCFSIKKQANDFNFCVIRENTEGLYAGFDYYPFPENLRSIFNGKASWQNLPAEEISCSLRLQSKDGLRRLFNFSFEYAYLHNMTRVTFADKPNVLRYSSQLSREIFEEVAAQYKNIKADILNIDAVALWLIRRPEEFGVIVAENMFGDILSDVGAGVMGGLGFAPSANIGQKGSYFEPVHGSAPRIKANSANPSAMFLTVSLLLEHFDYQDHAAKVVNAVVQVIKKGKYLTCDLGGKSSTQDMAASIIDACLNQKLEKNISFIATGDELINGDFEDKNNVYFAKKLSEQGCIICQHVKTSDDKNHIKNVLETLLNISDAVVITGGLGPTSDDNTRYALSELTKKELLFNEQAWLHIGNRLSMFNLDITESNRKQALFPKGAHIYPNKNGTAFGCCVEWKGRHIFMLPGPPKECIPMFDTYVFGKLESLGFFENKKIYRWLTIGLIEGEISPKIDGLTSKVPCQVGYCWQYPYVEIRLVLTDPIKDTVIDQLVNEIELHLQGYLISTDGKNSYDILKDTFSNFYKKIYLGGEVIVEKFISELSHSNLIFLAEKKQVLKEEISFILNTENSDEVNILSPKIIILQSKGYINGNKVYEHQMSTPNRDKDIEIFIKHYIAWQLCEFYRNMGAK